MHWGQGIVLGSVLERGLRGPVGLFLLSDLRFLNDQILKKPWASAHLLGLGLPMSRRLIFFIRRSTLLLLGRLRTHLLAVRGASRYRARPGHQIRGRKTEAEFKKRDEAARRPRRSETDTVSEHKGRYRTKVGDKLGVRSQGWVVTFDHGPYL